MFRHAATAFMGVGSATVPSTAIPMETALMAFMQQKRKKASNRASYWATLVAQGMKQIILPTKSVSPEAAKMTQPHQGTPIGELQATIQGNT